MSEVYDQAINDLEQVLTEAGQLVDNTGSMLINTDAIRTGATEAVQVLLVTRDTVLKRFAVPGNEEQVDEVTEQLTALQKRIAEAVQALQG